LAASLARFGWEATFADEAARDSSTTEFLRQTRGAQAAVLVTYSPRSKYYLRQVALLAAAGIPIVRWWVGTDVLVACTEPEMGKVAQSLQRFVSGNICVAPHLGAELASIGIESHVIPSVFDSKARSDNSDQSHQDGVLVYLPTERADFYGRSHVEHLVRNNPDKEFIVAADDDHRLAKYPNVTSTGWVGDLEPLWNRCSHLLRLTEHDGLPRMVLEALARKKHVIYGWPLAGCHHAPSTEAAQSALSATWQTGPNETGQSEHDRAMGSGSEKQFDAYLRSLRAPSGLVTRLRALGRAIAWTVASS